MHTDVVLSIGLCVYFADSTVAHQRRHQKSLFCYYENYFVFKRTCFLVAVVEKKNLFVVETKMVLLLKKLLVNFVYFFIANKRFCLKNSLFHVVKVDI